MSNQQQQAQEFQIPQRSPLLAEDLAPLGITIYLSIRNEFKNDRYLFRIWEYGYWVFLKKHPEYNREYIDGLNNLDRAFNANLLIDMTKKIKQAICIKCIKVSNPIEEVRAKILNITRNPNTQMRDHSVEIIRDNFNCDESDLQGFRDYLHQINSYTGSMLSVGMTENQETTLIIHIFSID